MDLADDEVIHMLSFLLPKDLCSVALTCDRFYKLANYGPLLRQLLMSVYGLSVDYFPAESDEDEDGDGSDSDNNGVSVSASSFYKEKYVAQNSMLQWSSEFHEDEIVISPDGKTAFWEKDLDNEGYRYCIEFLSKVPLSLSLSKNDQSPVYFEVQISAKNGFNVPYKQWFSNFGVQDISKSTGGIDTNNWDDHDHFICLYDDGGVYRTGGRHLASISVLQLKDGDFFGFVLHQKVITITGEEKEKDEESEKEDIAIEKRVKITKDIKLTKDESECDFYAHGYIWCQWISFIIQDKPSFLPPLK